MVGVQKNYPKTVTWQEYHHKIKIATIKLWSASPSFDRMALIDPDFSHLKFVKLMCSLSYNQASMLFQLRLRHVPLNTYLHRIKKVDSLICPCCQQHREMVVHCIMWCEAHTKARQTMFNAGGRDTRNIGKLLLTPDFMPHLFQISNISDPLSD